MISHRYIIFYLFCLHIDIYVNIYTRCFGVNASSNYLRNNVSTFDNVNVEDNNFVIGDNYYLNYEKNNQDIISNLHEAKLPNTSQEYIEVENENSHDPKVQDEEFSVIKPLGDHNHVKSNDIGVIGNDTTDGLSDTNSGSEHGRVSSNELTPENSTLQDALNKKCPNETICKDMVSSKHCPKKNFEQRNNWLTTTVKTSLGKNKSVPTPARRGKLCFGNITQRRNGINDIEKLKKELKNAAYSEAVLLGEMYSGKPEYTLEAMRYSFADIGSIIKGNDMLDDLRTKNLKEIFENKINQGKTVVPIINRESLWEENKNDIWDAMMCKYSGNKADNICPGHNNIDKVPQFFRWFREWGTYACKEIKESRELLKAVCNNVENKHNDKVINAGKTRHDICKDIFNEYENLVNSRKNEWKLFVEYFNNEKDTYDGSKGLLPEMYLKEYCPECYFQNKDLKIILEEIEKNANIYNDIYAGKYFEGTVTRTSHEVSNSSPHRQNDGSAKDGVQSGSSTPEKEITPRSDSSNSDISSTNLVDKEAGTGQKLNNLSGGEEKKTLESGKSNTDNERHDVSKDDIPYDRILGWEFGDFSPKNKYTEDEKKENMLELINLTSWDRDNISNENEEVEEEEKYIIDVGEIELEEEEEVGKEEEQQVEDEIEVEEEEQVEEEEDEEEVEEEKQKEGDTEATKNNLEEKDQTTKDTKNEKEETVDLKRDNDAYQSLKERSNDNKQVKKVDESAIKNLFDLFNKSNDSEDVLKGLVREITSLFQNQ
ncbi:conserved Plasmodium protein, unknown function [Plasmodium sp. gorilla clade G2]|uniref:conserved Plasmodium protein, unknown function n=1 Tax=Plasmodium sp. gorilla clade G2 TaxID=880535 RepID=UPI000D2ADBA6|nr:conserved Plasmodium protein, unknown function [Plasmodium sp. gorilla clade G2]SOV20199.1 conserved Plasmodium protein, unknown function [Plasmodium sp. gorilla clade G2]